MVPDYAVIDSSLDEERVGWPGFGHINLTCAACIPYALKTGPPPNLSGRGARFGVYVRDMYIATVILIHE